MENLIYIDVIMATCIEYAMSPRMLFELEFEYNPHSTNSL